MKNISIKVYRPSGEFIKEWTGFASFSTFSKEINAGLGECIIDLAIPFGYSGNDLEVNNTVDILVSDRDTASGAGAVRIYSGYISMYEISLDEKGATASVHLLGEYTRLSVDYLKNGSQTLLYSDATSGLTTTASGTSADTGLIMRAIINRYRAETANPKISYDQASIPLTGQSVLYAVNLQTYREAMDKMISMYTGYSFWYVDENGTISVKNKPSSPKHIFEMDKHVKSIKIQKNIENMRNSLLFWNGESATSVVYNHYDDDASIGKFGRRREFMKDTGISDSAAADLIGENYIAENKDPEIKITVEIYDNNGYALDSLGNPVRGYDIESIQPGDTCRFVGFEPNGANFVYDNMMITKVDYYLDRAVLTIEVTKSDIINWQSKTAKEVNDMKSSGLPATYS
jgi:hypothetical protein